MTSPAILADFFPGVKKPVWQEVEPDHYVACHLYDDTVEDKEKAKTQPDPEVLV